MSCYRETFAHAQTRCNILGRGTLCFEIIIFSFSKLSRQKYVSLVPLKKVYDFVYKRPFMLRGIGARKGLMGTQTPNGESRGEMPFGPRKTPTQDPGLFFFYPAESRPENSHQSWETMDTFLSRLPTPVRKSATARFTCLPSDPTKL